MSRAAISVMAQGIFTGFLSLTFFAVPDFALRLFGLPAHKDFFVYVAAMFLAFLCGHYIVAARAESRSFFQFSIPQRYSVVFFLAAFWLLNLTKVNIMLFSAPDVILATWTLLALRADARGSAGAGRIPANMAAS
jgi:hypothetical protein